MFLPLPFEATKARCDWEIIERDLDGKVISQKHLKNVILDTGLVQQFRNHFMLAASGGYNCMAVGASTTAADPTQTSLIHELSGNAQRKPLLSLDDDALTVSDIIQDITTIESVNYRYKVTCKAIWDSGDGNNGNQFGEFALVSDLDFAAPGEVFYNRLVDGAPTTKSSGNEIEAQMTVRFG